MESLGHGSPPEVLVGNLAGLSRHIHDNRRRSNRLTGDLTLLFFTKANLDLETLIKSMCLEADLSCLMQALSEMLKEVFGFEESVR